MTNEKKPATEALKRKLQALTEMASQHYEGLASEIRAVERELCRTPAGREIHRVVEDSLWSVPYAMEQLSRYARRSVEKLDAFLTIEEKEEA